MKRRHASSDNGAHESGDQPQRHMSPDRCVIRVNGAQCESDEKSDRGMAGIWSRNPHKGVASP